MLVKQENFQCFIPTSGTALIYNDDINKRNDFVSTYLFTYLKKCYVSGTTFEKTSRTFLPVNVNKSHWILIVIDWVTKTFYLYDSLLIKSKHQKFYSKAKYKSLFDATNRYVNICFRYFSLVHIVEELQFTYKVIQQLPIQKNGRDCGIYMILNAFYIYFGKELTRTSYGSSEADNCRYNLIKMILEYPSTSNDFDETGS